MQLIQQFYLSSDLDVAGNALAAAVARVSGCEVTTLDSWSGADKITGNISTEQEGPVSIEWLLRKGQFKLDLRIFGPGIPLRFTEAQFARALAKELRRPLLFSDCSAYPFSYFMAAPDGAILAVLVVPNEDDSFDLHSDDPSRSDYYERPVIFSANEALPQKPDGDGAALPRERVATCDLTREGTICEQFWTQCPRSRRSAV